MPKAAPTRVSSASQGFSGVLKFWRQRQRVSQMELALEAGVSQRHLSHLESGRSQPSRDMVLLLGKALQVPLREQNEGLLSAGYAPVFRTTELENPRMAAVLSAVERMLQHHHPYPAVAMDREWNVCRTNPAFDQLIGFLHPEAWERTCGGSRNLFKLFFHRDGLRPWVSNWSQAAPMVWQRACREADADGTGRIRRMIEALEGDQDIASWEVGSPTELLPMLPLVLTKDGSTLSLFSIIATFGTAQDITTDEMRIECFFPADEPSRSLLLGLPG